MEADAGAVAQITCPDARHRCRVGHGVAATPRISTTLLPGPKQFVQFTNADGAGDHCEILNRSLANRTILDWLDDTLGVA